MSEHVFVEFPGRAPRWRTWLGHAAGIFLGVVLLFAAWAKVVDPQAYVEQIRREGLDFLLPAWLAAGLGLAVEAALGFALVLCLRRLLVLVPAVLLVAFFLYLTSRNYLAFLNGRLDPSSSCGCFGNLIVRSPSQAFWSDLALLIPPAILMWVGIPPPPLNRLRPRLEIIVGGTLLVLVLAWKSPDLYFLDDLATRLHPGVALDELCVGEGESRACFSELIPEAAEGKHVVILADLHDPAFKGSLDVLDKIIIARKGGPEVWAVTAASPEDIQAFKWQYGGSFEIRSGPAPLLRQLYRALPRSFTVQDGVVTHTYHGMPPSEVLTTPADDDSGG
jgi:Methylamine utilisation protein MauE